MTLAAGTRIGRYEVRSKLGEGGMGEVYLADDTELGRPVALKFLPAEFAADEQRMQRFRLEARAASALDHENIITIYEIGEAVGAHFIASEYVRGETLRERVARARLPLDEVIAIGMQVASALAAAHEAGFVHRDVKPENVMIRPNGFVKVLDFGLAKLAERRNGDAADAEAPTLALVQTAPGMVMGTVSYMSPEQAAGLPDVDARTDVWSLGVLLYEMVAGRVPFWFEGATPTQILSMIIQKEAPPLKQFAPHAPDELNRIVMKALENSREDRYQSAREMLVDLRRLGRQLEREAEAERSFAPYDAAAAATASGGAQTRPAFAQSAAARPGAGTSEAAPAHRTSSAEYVVEGIRRHKGAALAVVALLALALAGAGYGVYRWATRPEERGVSFQSAKFARLTTTGKVIGVSISPDGRYVAHVIDDGGQQSLWVRQTAAPSDVQIVPPAAGAYYRGLAFSPDGNFVYYTVSERDDRRGTLYQVPVLGGDARKLLSGINSGVSFSPDGRQIAYFRRAYPEGGREDSLLIANADGTGERRLAKTERGVRLYRGPTFSSPAWSPDGRTIACPYGSTTENHSTVAAVSVETGEIRPLTPQRWFAVRQVEWLAGGGRLLFTAQDHSAAAPYQIWQLDPAAGEARRVTNDLVNYRMFSLTASSDAMAVVHGEMESNIWVMPARDSARATQITFGKAAHSELTWTPDGRIIYNSNAGDGVDLHLMDPRGGSPKRLTTDPGTDSYPQVTRDGRYVVFMSDRTGRPNIWRMGLDGSDQTRLTDGVDLHPHVSPDGRWVVYQSWEGNNKLRKVPLDGGQPVWLTDYISGTPAFSPDGRLIACAVQENPGSTLINIAVVSAEGGAPLKTFPLPGEGETNSNVLRWTADGREIVYGYMERGVSNLWAQPVDGGRPRQVTNFTSGRIFWFDFSQDGKQIALSRGAQTGDVVLIRDFR